MKGCRQSTGAWGGGLDSHMAACVVITDRLRIARIAGAIPCGVCF